MTRDEILQKVTSVFHTTFDDPTIVLTLETTAKDIPSWDSIVHITLIIEIESAFDVRFDTQELEKLNNVGALVSLLEAKL